MQHKYVHEGVLRPHTWIPTNPMINAIQIFTRRKAPKILTAGILIFLAACSPGLNQGQKARTIRRNVTDSKQSETVFITDMPSTVETWNPSTPDAVNGHRITSPTPDQKIPQKTPTQSAACDELVGKIVIDALETDLLIYPLEYRVYLPPCYASQTQRYPVLYLIHGQNATDDQWVRIGVGDALDRMISTGEVPPFIVVMPRDMAWRPPSGDPFGEAIMKELIPWVDNHLRTLAEKRFRAVGGLSRGAGWAIHLGLINWEVFGSIGAHSPAIFWEDSPHIQARLEAIPVDAMPRIFIDVGENDTEEILRSSTWLEETLKELYIDHVWAQYPGAHDEKYWKAHLGQYLHWYAEPWENN